MSNQVLGLVGSELIHGYQGARKVTSVKVDYSGVAHPNRLSRYPYGILRQRSPDGKRYAPLSPATVKWKRRQGKRGLATQALRLTDTMLTTLAYRVNKMRQSVRVDHAFAMERRLSALHEQGADNYPSTTFRKGNLQGKDTGPVRVNIPARPHRALQPQAIVSLGKIVKAWMDSLLKRKPQ